MFRIMLYFLYFIVLLVLLAVGIGFWLSAPKYQGPSSDHFNGKRFMNSGNIAAKGFKDLLKWGTNRQPGPWTEIKASPGPDPAIRVNGREAAVTFVNHSTFLIQLSGLNILTDPVWSKRVSPFSFVGPKRMRPPGIEYQQLPPIDVVIISHNHYDHLDINTMKTLARDHSPQFIVPLGVGAYLEKKGLENIVEVDWWDTTNLSADLTLHAVPAQHFSGRGMFDRDATLWCGYVLEWHGQHIYFAGDTGYGEFVHDISKKFQPMKLALLPIGAYLPTWFMSPIHTSPRDAVQMHLDLKSELTLGIHFGTFPLADDGMFQPQQDLEIAKGDLNVPSQEFLVPEEGKSQRISVN